MASKMSGQSVAEKMPGDPQTAQPEALNDTNSCFSVCKSGQIGSVAPALPFR